MAGRWVAIRKCTHKITWSFDHVVFRDLVIKWNYCIPTTTMPMATKVEGIVTYLRWHLPMMLLDPLRDIFWENRAISDKARKWPTQIFLIVIYIIHIIVKGKTLKFFSLKLYGLGVWAQQNSHLKEKKYSFFTDMDF